MNKIQLSMRKAHGKKCTFFKSLGENFKLRLLHEKPLPLLKFRHTQYAPVCARQLIEKQRFYFCWRNFVVVPNNYKISL